jgi:pyroglutamyl-peptidase
MAISSDSNGDLSNGDTPRLRTVTILVTGFGPFQDKYPVNPSFEIASSLPATHATAENDINIIAYGTPIRVCYDEVRELVPTLHEAYADNVDLVLHMGMASGRDFYTLELYGHRDGYYKNKDLDGKTLTADHGLRHFGDCPPMMTTSLDYSEILQRWKTNLSLLPESLPGFHADCRPSDDAGHYLCDYIYFNSLAWYERRSSKRDPSRPSARPVLFLHVPATSDAEMLEKGRQVTLALIEAMASVWSQETQL